MAWNDMLTRDPVEALILCWSSCDADDMLIRAGVGGGV